MQQSEESALRPQITNATSVVKIPRGQTPERRAYMKAYYATHPKRDRRAYKKAYDAQNAKRIKAWRTANKARLKARQAAYYLIHRDRILARVKARDAANPERVLEYHRKHYARNADRIKAYCAEYRKTHKAEKWASESQRRARKAGNGGSHTAAEWREKVERLGHKCYYCGKGGKLTKDHVLALKRGGTDDIDNLVPACRSCNSSKNAKPVEVYLTLIGNKPVGAYVGR